MTLTQNRRSRAAITDAVPAGRTAVYGRPTCAILIAAFTLSVGDTI